MILRGTGARALIGSGILLALAGIGVGCGGNEVPHGSPVLLAVYWQMLGGNANSCTATAVGDGSASPPIDTDGAAADDAAADGGDAAADGDAADAGDAAPGDALD